MVLSKVQINSEKNNHNQRGSNMQKQKAYGHKKSSRKPKAKPVKLKVPKAYKPDHLELEEWQRLLRMQFAEQQNFKLKNIGYHPVFSEFMLTNPQSGKTYKVAIRGLRAGSNYCSCPDYSINNLGTCKHIEFTLLKLQKKPGAKKAFRVGFVQPYSEIYLSYGLKREIRFKPGKNAPQNLLDFMNCYFSPDGSLKDECLLDFHRILSEMPLDGHEVRYYDDVLAFVAEHQDARHRRAIFERHLKNGTKSPIFKNILKTELYPYQREGALFATRAERCLIGDDMGLGKTIQALAASELMARLFNIQRVLIVSPTSLKYQWKTEIEKFTDRTAEVVEGLTHSRKKLYGTDAFYKLINYELVHKDIKVIGQWAPDLIILDEAQRIKNWNTRTAKSVKQLKSTFAIVLTGTPIENKLAELHSIVEFIDRLRLGPLYRFMHDHTIMDEGSSGKVIGYQQLESVRAALKDVLIRRKKDEVLKHLPERIDKNFFVPMTKEQQVVHDDYYEIVVKLVAKWRRYKFLCEADQKRLLSALNMMRMVSDNTYLVDKKTVHGPKIEELEILLKEIVIEGEEKVVIFSQWLRMNELVEHIIERNNIGYVHLNGSVPAKKRKDLMQSFKENPACKVFLSTDAGGVGLNLQSGSVVINMDIPWNPAVLEQRIGRIHRLGQQRSVRVVNFVTSASIEERILELLKFKKSLIGGALDADGENVVMLGESQLKKFMQSVETITENLDKARPGSHFEESERFENEKETVAFDTTDAAIATEEEEALPASGTEDVLRTLLQSGAQFLMDLGRAITGPDTSA
ncbi:MAG TPA: hypothetical protein DCP92_12260, partial [Nitrospiraceae bacterium]|nr:hypothetical protein [Nitrospiraceae bacterium]